MSEHKNEYSNDFVSGLEWMWGQGFLSPGGAEEIDTLLKDIDLKGKQVLDVGCGLGGIDVLLAEKYQADHVIGIDIEEPLIDRALSIVKHKNLEDHIEILLVEPGPLPFTSDTFDVVFSKDSLIHIEDKLSIYREFYRVLKPGGQLIFSDWLRGDMPDTPEWSTWLEIVGLSFNLFTLDATLATIGQAGFIDARGLDRNQWYQTEIQREIESTTGENFPKLVAAIGDAAAKKRVASNQARKKCVDQGLLRPTHVFARKPC